MAELLRALVIMSLGGSIMGLSLVVLRRLAGKRLPSAFYYYAWLLVLLRLILPIPGSISLVPTPEKAVVETGAVYSAALAAKTQTAIPKRPPRVSSTQQTGLDYPELIISGMEEGFILVDELPEDRVVEGPVNAGPVVTESDAVKTEAETAVTNVPSFGTAAMAEKIRAVLIMPQLWLGLWAVGVLISLAWQLGGYTRFCAILRKTALPPLESDEQVYAVLRARRKPALIRSKVVSTPMLIGLISPMLLLPDRNYSALRLEYILRHELTHHARHDIAYKWFAMLVMALHWFNPFAKLFINEIDHCCELSCDEKLLKRMDKTQKKEYGETLLYLATSRSLPRGVVATSFATQKRNLKERLEQIMTFTIKGKAAMALALAAALLLCGCGAVFGPKVAAQGNDVTIDTGVEDTAPVTAENEAKTETNDVQTAVSGDNTSGDDAGNTPVTDNGADEDRPVVPTAERDYTPQEGDIIVSTVDELLAAIAPGASIYLEPGEYNLGTASDYGRSDATGHYSWHPLEAGPAAAELRILNCDGLTITGAGEEWVNIVVAPRYANVLYFKSCNYLTVRGVNAGHTIEPGICRGGVLYLEHCDNALVENCGLYGCGIIGVTAVDCMGVNVKDSRIYDCSMNAVKARSCFDVTVENCEIYDCGAERAFTPLLSVETGTGFAVVGCKIHDNSFSMLIESINSDQVQLLGTEVSDFSCTKGMFYSTGYSIVVDGCSFEEVTEPTAWIYDIESNPSMPAVSPDGTELTDKQFGEMQFEPAVYDGAAAPEAPQKADVDIQTGADGIKIANVSTVDEFLAAIAPNTTIYLADGDYDLSTAGGYGTFGGDYYYWNANYDGPELVISNVSNLSIIGGGADKASITAVPRYADVIQLNNCDGVHLEGFTAGHEIQPGECTGNVIGIADSTNVRIDKCGLFGCGVVGIYARNSRDIVVTETEIYECSSYAVELTYCDSVIFANCNVRDCGRNGDAAYMLRGGCTNITIDIWHYETSTNSNELITETMLDELRDTHM